MDGVIQVPWLSFWLQNTSTWPVVFFHPTEGGFSGWLHAKTVYLQMVTCPSTYQAQHREQCCPDNSPCSPQARKDNLNFLFFPVYCKNVKYYRNFEYLSCPKCLLIGTVDTSLFTYIHTCQ